MNFLFFLFFLIFAYPTYADFSSKLNVATTDGSVSNYPYKLKVTAGTLTDNGDGTMTLQTGSGGGGGVTVYPATATASFPFGLSASTFTSSAFNVTSTSASVMGAAGLNVRYGTTMGTATITGGLLSLTSGDIQFGDDGNGQTHMYVLGSKVCINQGGCGTLSIGSIGIGFQALNGSGGTFTGADNIAIGDGALEATTSANTALANNIAIGKNALSFTGTATTGNSVAIGQGAIGGNTAAYTGGEVTAVGGLSNFNNVSGIENAGFGYHTLYDDQSGFANTALGSFALEHSLGTSNVAVGHSAGGGGDLALASSLVTGNNNIFMGYKASVASSNTVGQDVIVIGRSASAGQSFSTPVTLNNAIAIGKNAVVTTSNTMVLGGTGSDSVGVLMTSAAVTYNVAVGSITGAGLSTCGDGTHALSWTSATNLFGCQAITASGGGGASSLAVTTGTVAGFIGPPVSSPTAVVNFNSSQFVEALTGGATAFVSLNTSSVTLLGQDLSGSYLTTSSATATYLNKNQATNGTVTSVSGTSPVNSSGGNTPAISLSQTIGQPETFTSSVTITNAVSISSNLVISGTTFYANANAALTGSIAASNLSGTNTGDQTITLTGNVTGSGTGSFATTLASPIGSSITWTGSNTYSNPGSTQTYNNLIQAVMTSGYPRTVDSAGAVEAANVFVSETATADGGVSVEGVFSEAVGNIGSGTMSKGVTGFNAIGYISNTDSATYTTQAVPGELRGGTMAGIYAGSGTINTGTGLTAFTQKKPSTHGVTTNLFAVEGWNLQQSAFAGVASQGDFFAKQPLGTVGGNVTNQYGLYIEKQASAANPATNHYGVYQADSGDQNLFAGTFYATGVVGLGGASSAVSISSNAILPGATFYQNGTIQTSITASKPVKTDAAGFLTGAAVNLSGAEVTGVLAAASFPAMLGDVTNTAGNLTNSLITTVPNDHTFSGAITFSNGAAGVILSAGAIRLFSRTLAQISAITPGAVGETYFCSDCSALQICVSSGTTRGGFASPVAKTTRCS